MSMCCASVFVYVCVSVCVPVGWAVGAGWKSSFSLGTFHPESPGSGRWPATEAQKDPGARGQTGHPVPGLASEQLPDQKLSARMAAWLLRVELPSASPSLCFLLCFSTSFSLSLSFSLSSPTFLASFFSQAAPCLCAPWEMSYLTWFPYD